MALLIEKWLIYNAKQTFEEKKRKLFHGQTFLNLLYFMHYLYAYVSGRSNQ